jgi:FkbM family methyltransferase
MVFGFEPNPESIACITNKNNQKQHHSHGECLQYKYIDEGRFMLQPCALSSVETPATMKFYISNNDCGTSSLYPNDESRLGKIKSVIDVPVYSLKMFFDGFPWDRFQYIDYIKIDAQGSDLNILKSAGSYLSERVVYVTAEGDGDYYIGANECSAKNIISYMESQGFVLIHHPNTRDPTFVNKQYIEISQSIYIKQE